MRKAITRRAGSGQFWEIITECGVGLAVESVSMIGSAFQTYWTNCLWDTGASHSSITKEAADALKLEPYGEVTVLSAQGDAIANCYLESLNLPGLIFIPSLRVTECASNYTFGFIIGMDIISMGDFARTNMGGSAPSRFVSLAWRPSIMSQQSGGRIADYQS